ncbi:MAG TPA: hypothetical protein DDW90_04150 [Cyanobacteria bacterium UBA9971]|nr:hypothetical protein [Cyanobacteria bacterium UBA9971]
MPKVRLKEQIANYRNTQTHLWTAMMVTISGSLALLQFFNTTLNKILSTSGFILFFVLFNFYLNLDEIVKNLTEKLEDLK